VALETADVVVMGEDLGALARAVRLSRRTRRIVKQNLVFAVGMMAALVFAALMGWIGLTAGVIGHEGSTVVVVFNGLRLLADGR
jgi:cation transport ATPase